MDVHNSLLASMCSSGVEAAMPQVAEQVVSDVQKCLHEHGFPSMNEERVGLLKGQVTSANKPDHPVYKLIRKCKKPSFFTSLLPL